MIINSFILLQRAPIVGMLDRKVQHNGVSHGLSELGYDIRIKQDVLFKPAIFHMSGAPVSGPWHCVGDGPRSDGNFCLASAIEQFDMPTDLGGIVHDKSTWARHGLSVYNTVIEPGWKGFLTLELVYHGQEELHIPAGSGIAQVIFHQVAMPTAYDGKYQNQADGPVQAILPR
jgi:dCTP deaminase